MLNFTTHFMSPSKQQMYAYPIGKEALEVACRCKALFELCMTIAYAKDQMELCNMLTTAMSTYANKISCKKEHVEIHISCT